MLSPNHDPRPLRIRIVEALRKHPDGATTKQLAVELGDPQYTISGIVSKMFMYGAGIDKVGTPFGPGTRWRLRASP